MPRLIVIKGNDEGRQFPLSGDILAAGRDSASRIRLTDTEASRRHAEFIRSGDGYRVRDVGSANGTFVNNQSILDVQLRPGDHIQIGQTVLVYSVDRVEPARGGDLADRISLITRQDLELSSAIVKAVEEAEGSRIMAHPDQVEGPWQHNAQALGVLYEATQLISHTLDLNQLLERILELVFRTLQADRGCILLRTSEPLQEGYGTGPDPGPVSSREFEPKAVRQRAEGNATPSGPGPARPGEAQEARPERIPISRTIVDFVLQQKQGILVSDALRDERFQAVQSIVRSGIREVICVPMKGRHQTLGVLYLDTNTAVAQLAAGGRTGKFTGDHLSLAIAIAHQAALAVEETRYYRAMLHAEQLAAVGQTVAALSHDLKNILNGLSLGGNILEQGIREKDDELLQRGWRILSKNQGRIHDLVLNMLSYSKEREPCIEPTDLNALVREVVELLLPRARDRSVQLGIRLDESLPKVPCDPEAIHRALLNIVTNAIDAVEESQTPKVLVLTGRLLMAEEVKGAWADIQVRDNGPGIPPEKYAEVFRPFVSTKGARGTGLGLAVSRKILREHGGDITLRSVVGQGSHFTLRLPLRSPLGGDGQRTRTDIPVAPPPD